MNKLAAYISLLRPVNLVIIALTQLLFWFYIVDPVHNVLEVTTNMQIWQVLCLILSTVLIAAGGYVINDYYDLPIDLVNKPNKVVISKSISDNAAFNYYMVLTGVGMFAALTVAWKLGKPTLVLLPIIIASLLWFYAQEFKRSFLLGNLIVGASTAAVIFILLLFEVDWEGNSATLALEVNEILKFGLGYMIFAFLMTMLREVVKDLQDMEGDAQFECRTLPIVWGELPAKIVAMIWLDAVLIALGWLAYRLLHFANYWAAAYILILLIFPGLVVQVRIWKASEGNHYKAISKWIKAMMLIGIITMIYVGLILGKHG